MSEPKYGETGAHARARPGAGVGAKPGEEDIYADGGLGVEPEDSVCAQGGLLCQSQSWVMRTPWRRKA